MAFTFQTVGLPAAVIAQIGEYAKFPDSQRRGATRDCAEWIDDSEDTPSPENEIKLLRPGFRILRRETHPEEGWSNVSWNTHTMREGGDLIDSMCDRRNIFEKDFFN